ncbi:MmpS family transport accessory protein [Actinoplanes sp. NPDC020271]|uniref:MmpS family transport accessory protein n=1 Tax=Actinoplanes sp. NPDC020271 TaxID=3363896 RepID=UPI0037B347F8
MSYQEEPSRDYPPTSEFPPVGYAPPGHGPRSPYGPPPPAPRRSNAPLIALILAVSLLLCGGVVTTGVLLFRRASDKAKEVAQQIPTTLPTKAPTVAPSTPGSSAKITVKYEVSGDGPATVIYTEKLGGLPKTVNDAALPWKLALEMEEGLAFASVSALRTSLQDGSITCRATIDGKTVSEHTTSGIGATATCNKVTFN